MKKKELLHMVPGGPRYVKDIMMAKIISGMGCYKFDKRQKKFNYFCILCPKSAVRGVKLNFWKTKLIGASATKS